MRTYNVLIIFLIFILINCKNSNYKIVDDIPPLPCEIIRTDLVFPDSLGGKSVTGRILVEVEVDSNCIIKNYDIILIKLKSDNIKFSIDYRSPIPEYSSVDIRRYKHWVEKYLQSCTFNRRKDISYFFSKFMLPIPVNKPKP